MTRTVIVGEVMQTDKDQDSGRWKSFNGLKERRYIQQVHKPLEVDAAVLVPVLVKQHS